MGILLKNKTLLYLLAVTLVLGLHVQTKTYDKKYLSAILYEAWDSYKPPRKKSDESESQLTTLKKGIVNTLKSYGKEVINPYTFQERSEPFAVLLARYLNNEFFTPIKEHDVIDLTSIMQLELLKGRNRAADSIIHHIITLNNAPITATALGHKAVIETISMPVNDPKRILQHQKGIHFFMQHEEIRNACKKLLKNIQHTEVYLNAKLGSDVDTSVQSNVLYARGLLGLFGIDEIPLAASVVDFKRNLLQILLSYQLMKNSKKYAQNIWQRPRQNQRFGMSDVRDIGAGSYFVATAALGLGNVKMFINIQRNIQDAVLRIAKCVRSMQSILELLSGYKDIREAVPTLSSALERIKTGSKASKKFNSLNNLLRKPSLKKEQSSLFAPAGDYLVANSLLGSEKIQAEYAPILHVIGLIDSYVGFAEKMIAHKHFPSKYCFAQLIDSKEKPQLIAKEFWNPFIDQKKAVTNSISLGTETMRNMLLSGPNTAGKSTTMKALMIAIILAQSYGIAPAKSFSLTPFSKLMTYLNITDDTAAGISLFKAETMRASALIDTLEKLSKDQFAFVLVDEIFTGTAPEKAKELAYRFYKKLNTFKSAIFVAATHFRRLETLEKETGGQIKNYHLDAIVDEKGIVKRYTYKLVPGYGKASSAEQIAKESGITF